MVPPKEAQNSILAESGPSIQHWGRSSQQFALCNQPRNFPAKGAEAAKASREQFSNPFAFFVTLAVNWSY
jgi:hypothetical protein